MLHVSSDELVLFRYEEAADADRIRTHLATCADCRRELDLLTRVLAQVDHDEAPIPEPSYGLTVWNAIEPRLDGDAGHVGPASARRPGSWQAWLRWLAPQAALASAVAALVAVAALPGPTARPDVVAQDAVLVGAVEDHLERTGLMLAELNNAETAADVPGVPAEAEDLAAANRLYRQTAVRTGDQRIGRMLDDLERVLLEVAHSPSDSGDAELETLRGRLDTRGVAFKVRAAGAGLRAAHGPQPQMERVDAGL